MRKRIWARVDQGPVGVPIRHVTGATRRPRIFVESRGHVDCSARRMQPRLLAAWIVLIACPARAETVVEPPPPPPAPAPAAPHHRVSLTFSPIHLLFPIIEIAGEVALDEHVSVAGIVGVGSVPLQVTSVSAGGTTSTTTDHLSAWELGAHVNYYVVGSFEHGMQLGVEALYLKVDASGTSFRSAGSASGLAIGPYVGYKLITGVGFTFEANLGAQYITASGESPNGTETAARSKWIPLLNLNVGWSF